MRDTQCLINEFFSSSKIVDTIIRWNDTKCLINASTLPFEMSGYDKDEDEMILNVS